MDWEQDRWRLRVWEPGQCSGGLVDWVTETSEALCAEGDRDMLEWVHAKAAALLDVLSEEEEDEADEED